jgi:sec-independent protein translocase protein TatA
MGGFSSMSHWLIVLAIIVLLFGAKKIPELAKGMGKGIKNFKEALNEEDEKSDKKELASDIDTDKTTKTNTKTDA